MSKQTARPLSRLLLLVALVVVYALVASPGVRTVRACNPPPWLECIELTVFDWADCRCECPDEACCEYYMSQGFTPYGCPGNP